MEDPNASQASMAMDISLEIEQEMVDSVVKAMADISIQDSSKAPDSSQALNTPGLKDNAKPVIRWPRLYLLRLSKSPLVKPPDDMPTFKDWFGEWADNNSNKKDAESSGTGIPGRERRYRGREPEDGDSANRPTFRATALQPSQMGNFKHQSIRGDDRDRDTDLRTLSDKFDREKARSERDRLGLPAQSTLLRNRETSFSSSVLRGGANGQDALNSAARRIDGKDSGRRRNGENSEDWRRVRDDRLDPSRRDRDGRERPRSRVRDTSRQRGSPPQRRGDRDEKDKDKDQLDDDGRHWRDDGKREERIAARREKDRDSSTTLDERDGRMQKRNHRDRRAGGVDAKDKDEKKDREREKEKEPAWMATYVPDESTGGILGGKAADGSVDSLQAWKQNMKEKELKEKGEMSEAPGTSDKAPTPDPTSITNASTTTTSAIVEPKLDEIQMFKMMMKRDQQQRAGQTPEGSSDPMTFLSKIETTTSSTEGRSSSTEPSTVSSLAPGSSSVLSTDTSSTNGPDLSGSKILTGQHHPTTDPAIASISLKEPRINSYDTYPQPTSRLFSLKPVATEDTLSSIPKDPAPNDTEPPRSRLLALGAQSKSTTSPLSQIWASGQDPKVAPNQHDAAWAARQRGPSPSVQQQFDLLAAQSQNGIQPVTTDRNELHRHNLDQQFASGSRILGSNVLQENFMSPEHPQFGRVTPNAREAQFAMPPRAVGSGIDRPPSISTQLDMLQMNDNRFRKSTPPASLYTSGNPISPVDAQGLNSQFSGGKGSRFAKFFDGKPRDGPSPGAAIPGQNLHGLSPSPGAKMLGRADIGTFPPPNNNNSVADSRAFGDIIAMLNNSAQQNQHVLSPHGSLSSQQPHLHNPQQQMLSTQPPGLSQRGGRLDNLFDQDEGRFVSDGLVPGLRPNVSSRRENQVMIPNHLEEPIQLNPPRAQQQGGLDRLFPVAAFGGANAAHPAFQQRVPSFRPQDVNAAAAMANFNAQHNVQQNALPQRMPAGLANLGGRLPQDPSQFLNGGPVPNNMVMNNPGLPAALHSRINHQQLPNQHLQGPAGLGGGFGSVQGHLRGPGANSLAHLNALGGGMNGVATLGAGGGAGGNMGLTGLPQNQMLTQLGMAGSRMNFNQQQQQPGLNNLNNLNNLNLGGGAGPILRPQQQHLPPHLLHPGLHPMQHMPQHGVVPDTQHNQNDLMAILMGGVPRE